MYRTFHNRRGDSISVRFREFQPKDAEAIVNLIREEYGDNYNNPDFYSADKLIERYNEGKVIFQVAETAEGQIVACLNIKRNFPREGYRGMGTGIVLKDYRQYHIFEPLIKYVMEQIGKLDGVTAIYAVLVMYQSITQKLIDRLGFTVCGVTPSMVIAENFIHSYEKDENQKYTFLFTVRNLNKDDVGAVYVPAEHEAIIKDTYKALGVTCQVNTDKVPLNGASAIAVDDDATQRVCTIDVDSAGEDLKDKIKEIENNRQAPLQTFNVQLNIKDSKAVAAYECLKSMGYFFAGLKPLISREREVMIMHNPNGVAIHFDTLKTVDSYTPLKEYVQKSYESRCKRENR